MFVHTCGIQAQHQKVVVRHQRIGADIGGQGGCGPRQALANVRLPLIAIIAEDWILATEEGPSHAATNAVVQDNKGCGRRTPVWRVG